jgi:hypothetical protein
MNYRISVWMKRAKAQEWSLSIRAENAFDAILTALRLMRISSLENITGIEICEL